MIDTKTDTKNAHLGEFADDPRIEPVTDTYYGVGETGRCLYIAAPEHADWNGWWLAIDDDVVVGEYDDLVDALRALLGTPDPGGRRRRFWTTARTLLRGGMWLTYAVGLWSLMVQADQLAGAAFAGVACLLFAGLAALASWAAEGGRNHG